jgi:hypothetical protein
MNRSRATVSDFEIGLTGKAGLYTADTRAALRRQRLHRALDSVLDAVYAKRAKDWMLNAPMPKNEANI